MNKLKKIRYEVISQNILDNIRIREIEFGNLKFYHNNDRSNNINITTDLNFNLNNDGIITNNTTDYNTIVNGDFNNYLILDKNTAIFQKFIEFDFDLNYDIPNFLNSLSYTKLYWNTPNDMYTDERIYPSQYARLNYFDKIDGDSSDIYIIENAEYDNGIYEIAYSTRHNSTNNSPHYVFSSQNITYHNDATWQNNQYDNGEYIGNHFFNNLGYYGDWITIKMPVNIIPTKIRFVSTLLNSNYTNRLPKKYRLYGYFNYAWELIIDDYIDDDYEYETYNSIPNIAYTKNIENAKNYNKYALIVNKIGNTHVLAMSNFEIFGREVSEKTTETSITNLGSDVVLWHDAKNIDGTNNSSLTNGNIVTSWNNLSSSSFTTFNGSSYAPTYNGTGLFFNGANAYNSTINLNNYSTMNIFVVWKPNSIHTNFRWLWSQDNGGYDRTLILYKSDSGTKHFVGRGNGGAASATYNFTENKTVIVNCEYNTPGQTGKFYINNSLNTSFSSLSPSGTNNTFFGALNSSASQYIGASGITGDMYEIIIINRLLTSTERLNIYNHLEQKWISEGDSDDVSTDPVTTPIASINTLDSNYKYVVFQNTGDNQTSYNITFNESTLCDILIVGGGGSGGVRDAGGGGAGGLIYLTNVNILNSNLSVGKGGASRTSGSHISGYKGNNSFIVIDGITYTAEGGGKGGQWNESNNNSTGSGGSGGGGGGNNSAGGTGNQQSSTSGGYGNNGAQGSGSYSGGGGGGAGGAGTRHSGDTGGNGGIGMDFSAIFGTEYGDNGWFAGGGGMGSGSGANGTGGLGGGGNGANSGDAKGGMDGTGGGGGGHRNSGGTSGKGGDGIIIIRYVHNNISSNFLELKTKILDDDGNVNELNNTILNRTELIHGIKNGIMTSYNMTKYVLFKEERLYPPYYKSGILLFENFFIENKIYGNGQYEIQYSSTYYENDKPLNIFRNNYYNGMWQSNSYTWNNQPLNTLSARSLFNGTSYLKDSSYTGEWITINLPYKILLTKFIIALLDSNSLNISTYDNAIYYFPHDFRIYGKNNNEDWELIIHKNINKTNLNNKYDNQNNLNVAFEYKLSDNDRLTKFKTFENYGLVVSQIGGKEYLNFSKWDIYGKELTSILDNKPDNIPTKKNVKFSQLSKVFDDKFDNKNIKITNYYLENLDKYDHNISIPNNGIISLSNFKSTSSFIDNIPLVDNIYARYETKYESLYISDNIVKQWYDSSGYNRHITKYRGNPIVRYFERGTKGTIGNNYFNVIKGDYNSGYKLPFRLNFDYTFCYVARYVGDKNNTTYNRRIFDSSAGTGQNTLWGFHGNHSGRSHNYKSGWHTTTHKQHSETDYWMIGIETQNTARYNGQDCTNYYEYIGINYPQKYSDYNVQLSINYGYYTGETYSTEISNWEIAEIIFYDKELNLDEKINVENYLAEKYGHISFSNVIENLENYKTIIKSQNYVNDLSDMWYYVYDGYKYGYSDITDKFYGPVNFRFVLYKYIDDDYTNKYYWILELKNNNNTNSSSNYDNRNTNLQSYNIKIPYANSYFSVVSGGGGGGGGSPYIGGIYTSNPGGYVYTRYQNYRLVYSKWPSSAYYNFGMYWDNTYGITIYQSGGGSGGGQAYIHDYLMTEELNLTVDIGSRGKGFAYPSPGGDTTTKWVDSSGVEYIIKGNGGLEGHAYTNYRGITNGGQYEISPSHISHIGGGNGGNSVLDSYNRQAGGPISTILKTINLNSNTSIWDILDEFFTYWSDRRIRFHWEQGIYYGAGGPGGQKYYNGAPDKFARGSYAGGPGYVFMILDFNNIETSTSNTTNISSSVVDNTNSTSSY